MDSTICKYCRKTWRGINATGGAVIFVTGIAEDDDGNRMWVGPAHIECAAKAGHEAAALLSGQSMSLRAAKLAEDRDKPADPGVTSNKQIVKYIRSTNDQCATPMGVAAALGWRLASAEHWMRRLTIPQSEGEKPTLTAVEMDGETVYVVTRDRDERRKTALKREYS